MNAFNQINSIAAEACGIAPRDGWASHITVAAEPKAPTPCADTAIEVAAAAIRTLRNFQRDMRDGHLVAAENDRKQAIELVSRALAGAWFAAFEEAYGPAPVCSQCGMIEPLDCVCDPAGDDEEPWFAEVVS